MTLELRTMGLLGSIGAGLLVAAACGTETGNPEGTVELQYNARSTSPAVSLTESDNDVVVDAVWLRLSPVELLPCDADAPVVVDGLGLTDHSGADAVVQRFDLPDQTYCEARVSMETSARSDDEPEVADGASIVLTGSLSDDRRFQVVVPTDQAFDIPLADQSLPSEGGWLLSFDVGVWIDAGVLEGLAGDPVVVSDTDNNDALDALVDRLADGVRMHLDANGNGIVDAGEQEL